MRKTTEQTYRGKQFVYDSFDNLEEFYTAADGQSKYTSSMLTWLTERAEGDRPHFTGLCTGDILKYKYGYPEGVEKLRSLPELNIRKGGVKYAHRWHEDDGDDMDMERYYDGSACMRKRYKTTGASQQGRFVEIKVKLDVHGGVTYEGMLWKAYAACRIIDQLEASGVRVKVTVCDYSTFLCVEGTVYGSLDVTVKQFNQPLNISLLANVCSPWFYRYWMFRYDFKTFNVDDEGIGRSMTFAEFDDARGKKTEVSGQDLILIDSLQCLTSSSAETFIKALEM
jgi:hypothetical protein